MPGVPVLPLNPEQVTTAVAAAAAVSFVASVLLLLRGAGTRVPGCGAGSGCDAVTSSRWSRLGPIPVVLPAALVYAALLACAFLQTHFARPLHLDLGPNLPQALIGLLALAAAAAVWFLMLQLLVLRRFCFYCVLAHLAALAAAAIVVMTMPIPRHWNDPLARAAGVGVAIVLLLIVLQLLIRPRLHRFDPAEEVMDEPAELRSPPVAIPEPEAVPEAEPEISIEVETALEPDAAPATATPMAAEPAAPAAPPPPPPARVPPPPSRPVTLLGGRLHFDATILPMHGPHQAKYLIAVLLDYTCEFCRQLHPIVEEAIRAFNGDLAALVVLSPMEPACNPLVEEFDPRHTNACTYARLALAVSIANEAQFSAFHHWLLEGEHPPSVEEAQRRATELAGGEIALRNALASEGVKQRLNDSLTLYRLTGKAPLPRMLLPTGILSGVSDLNSLLTLLRRAFTVPHPAPPPPSSQFAPVSAQIFPPSRGPQQQPQQPRRSNPFSDQPIS